MINLVEQGRAAGYGDPFSREKNNEVYERLVKGDETARDEMIHGNLAVVVFRVDAHLRRAPQFKYYRKDMISAGLLALCEAIDTMQRKGQVENANPTGYICTSIEQAIGKLTDEDSTIVVPQRSQDKARQEGKKIEHPRTIGGNAAVALASRLHASDPLALVELEEEIRACCRDETDMKIVELRAGGDNDNEIAKALGLGRSTVATRRKDIYERLKERCPEYAR